MSRNLRSLMRQAVFDAFSEHASKRAMHGQDPEEARSRIFSYGTRNQLLDRVNDFCRHTDARRPGQLTPAHVTRYLDAKAGAGCTQATLDEYRSELVKLGRIIGIDLQCGRVYADRPAAPDRGAASAMPRADLDRLLEYAKAHPSASGVCLQLEALIGVRVADLAYGITVEPERLVIRSKNGKICHRSITPAIRAVIDSKAFKRLLDGDKLRAPKDNSLNTYLRRTEDRLGLERHSWHDIRRTIAQERYDDFRNSGLSRSEALRATSAWLNHGPGRESMLLKSYISNAW